MSVNCPWHLKLSTDLSRMKDEEFSQVLAFWIMSASCMALYSSEWGGEMNTNKKLLLEEAARGCSQKPAFFE